MILGPLAALPGQEGPQGEAQGGVGAEVSLCVPVWAGAGPSCQETRFCGDS